MVENEYLASEKVRLSMSLCVIKTHFQKCMREKGEFERQCAGEDVERKRYRTTQFSVLTLCCRIAEGLRIIKEKNDAFRETSKRIFAQHEEHRKNRNALQVLNSFLLESHSVTQCLDLLKSTCNLAVHECQSCFLEFTPVMTFEEQRRKGISAEEFERMNLMESTEERCWRNKALPCQHAVVSK